MNAEKLQSVFDEASVFVVLIYRARRKGPNEADRWFRESWGTLRKYSA
jgi:hypothetical protein